MTRSASYLSPLQMFRLDLACKPMSEAFGHHPYLVGSVSETPDFRDVDVRLILPDKEYDRLFHGQPGIAVVLGMAVSDHLRDMAGLPIDFQFQRQTDANELHNGKRNPLGTRRLRSWTGDATPLTGRPAVPEREGGEADVHPA